MNTHARRAAERRGHAAERRAALWLRLKGYRILAERFRAPQGEVDLIAIRGRTLAFVEVKARATLADALEAVTPHQRARIAGAAEAFLIRRPDLAEHRLRFDVIAQVPGRLPNHIVDAWRP